MTGHRPARLLLFSALLLAGLLSLTAAPALAVDLVAAKADLDQLRKSYKNRKSTNEDLQQYLEAVASHAKDGGIDAPPEPPKPAEDAPQEEQDAWAKEHAAWKKAMANFEKEIAEYRDDTEKLFLRILTLVKAQDDTNIRDDVNIQAARLLGEMAPALDEKAIKSLSRKITTAIEKNLTKVKTHQVNTDLLDAAFESLGKLNDVGSLEWMNKNYVHTKDTEKAYLIAAHKAMVHFTSVPGKLRKEIVDNLVKVYAGVELQAEQSSTDVKVRAKKDFWDAIKVHTIPVVQYYAGKPANDEGAALSEMKQFEAWLRDHKNVNKAPWADPKPIKK